MSLVYRYSALFFHSFCVVQTKVGRILILVSKEEKRNVEQRSKEKSSYI